MRRVEVAEYERATVADISPDTARALNRTDAVRATRSWAADAAVLQARSIVGVIQTGSGEDAVELHVAPKVGIGRLLWLLGHARDQSGWREDDVELGSEIGLVAAMAVMFAARARRALTRGVLRGYREHEDTLPALRGRLREADQMRARPGIPLPLEVRFDEYTTDIIENQLLRTAAVQLLDLSGIPPQARMELNHLARLLADVSILNRGTAPPRVTLTRLNQPYAPALALARLVLERTSVEHQGRPTWASGFAFDMNHVYEDWLTAALKTSLERRGGTVSRQRALDLDQAGRVKMQTDISWWRGNTCLAVIDAKYKRLQPTGPRPDDLYQVLAYCTALELNHGHLVYPAGGPPQTIVVRNAGVHLHAHVIPLAASPGGVLSSIENLAAAVAAQTSAL
jgi:5-methylcytosine-specific restriction enzyme subunit McrC